MMPNIDGYALLSKIRENPAWAHIPFIYLTAKGSEQEIHQGRKLGVEEYITKPYDLKVIIELLVSKLERSSQIQSAVNADFGGFKHRILGLLERDLLSSVFLINKYSDAVANSLNKLESAKELKASLAGLRDASHHFAIMMEDFIKLAEIKAGITQQTIDKYRAILFEVTDFLAQVVGQVRGQSLFPDCQLILDEQKELPALYCDIDMLAFGLNRLLFACTLICRQYQTHKVLISSDVDADDILIYIKLLDLQLPNDTFETIQQICHGIEVAGNDTLGSQPQDSLFGQEFVEKPLSPSQGMEYTDERNPISYLTSLKLGYWLVHLHDGTIQVDNDPQSNVYFMVKLPAYTNNSIADLQEQY